MKKKVKKEKIKLSNFVKSHKIILIISLAVILAVIAGIIAIVVINNKVNTCYVLFNTNGGQNIDGVSLTCGEKITSNIQNPTKEGFDFEYWSIDGKKINISNYVINRDVTFDANWKIQEGYETITIHFDSDGGSIVNDVEIIKGGTLYPPLDPIKEGYVFKNWLLGNERFDFTREINEDLTLKASWEKAKSNDNNRNTNQTINESNSQTENQMKAYDSYAIVGEKLSRDVVFYSTISSSDSEYYFSYTSSVPSVASIDSNGNITAKSKGVSLISMCQHDKKTKAEISCVVALLTVKLNSDSEGECTSEDALAFADAINNYYWYLDGYKYAYFYTKHEPWYEHTLVSFEPNYMGLEGNKIVTEEDGNIDQSTSRSNFQNELLMNPASLGCIVIEKHNIKLNGTKMYITFGKNQYSFTRSAVRKKESVLFTLSKSNIVLNKRESTTVDVSIIDSFLYPSIEVKSSNNEIANCYISDMNKSNGKITCTNLGGYGTATITVTDTKGGNTKSFTITVNEIIIPVSKISISDTNLELIIGDTKQLTATISPSNANNKKYTWKSSNSGVATVDSNGKIKAISNGTATITATSEDGGYTAECLVTVSKPKLTASASAGFAWACSQSGCGEYTSISINASGGTAPYSYSYSVYKDGVYIGTFTEENIYLTRQNGTYKIDYSVTDSDGTTVSGSNTSTIKIS